MTNKILVTGGSGLVGRALRLYLPNAIYASSYNYDLRDPGGVDALFVKHRPNHIIHLAGKVGGVGINLSHPVEFFEDNILINTNVLREAHRHGVGRLVSCMSTCVFPNDVEYPLQPDKIHLGEPHPTNFGYAYAKRMLEVQTRAYRQQYNKEWFTAIPTNIYGPHDNFNLESSHVIPALIHKCYIAKQTNTPWVIWGSGRAIREFVFVSDVACVLANMITSYSNPEPLIISTPHQCSIREVVRMISQCMEFDGEIIYDDTKPEGQYRKPSDISPLRSFMPDFRHTSLETGIELTVKWFTENYESSRK